VAILLLCLTMARGAHPPVSARSDVPRQPACATSATGANVVLTDAGAVQGMADGGVQAFEGIPYAAPPLGDLRFRPPAPHACWSDTLQATAFGNECPQIDVNDKVVGDEDCLTLNIWTPNTTPSAPLPVLFFIHGGGNTQGASSSPLYDGSYIAAHGPAVVVTINYRLGVFGFLAAPALDAASAQGVSGNYGILDQIAALQWTQRNIAAFGGDPSRVLLFGESAGATDTCVLLASPLASGLFSRALMESGGCNQRTLADSEQTDAAVVQSVGCDTASDVAACLRALPAATLVQARKVPVDVANLGGLAYGPNVDGYVLPGEPLALIGAGTFNQVPFVVGSNADETAGLAPPPIADAAAYETALTKMYGATIAQAVLQEYPASAYPTPRQAYIAATTDADFVCPSRDYARAAATGGSAPVYRYFFTHALDHGVGKALGAFHGLELAFVFHTLGASAGYSASADEQALADAIVGYWTRFAATGDPNGAGATPWPIYDTASDTYVQLDTTISAGQGVRTTNCDFWDYLEASIAAR
jgi:para-nitrobenzyl esterase